MTHEEEIERAERAEAAFRKGLTPLHQPSHGSPIVRKPKPDPSQTYFGMSQMSIGMDNNDHAFLVGSGGAPPFAPPAFSSDPGLEPPTGEDINAVPDMTTVAHGGSALSETYPQAEESESELNPMEDDDEP
jgi:hypothetical protein